MEAKKKAKELVDKFGEVATQVVDEILNERWDHREQASEYNNNRVAYWQMVKLEIERL